MNLYTAARKYLLRHWAVALGLTLSAGAFAAEHETEHAPEHAATATSSASSASAHASEAAPEEHGTAKKPAKADSSPSSSTPIADKIRAALAGTVASHKKTTMLVESSGGGKGGGNDNTPSHAASPSSHGAPGSSASILASERYKRARAAAWGSHSPSDAPAASAPVADMHASGEVHWAYDGENGPQAWGKLKPDFNVCATGKRQSPIAIEDGNTLQGPAEPLQFAYAPSNGTVVNNGHTIQVNVQGENSVTVRGSTFRLLQFHFHTPSEEQINAKRFPMVVHLVHRNNEGQLAVVAVLLEEGASNPFIDKVWTYMPLDNGDQVRMPQGLLNLTELLPTDQRYYQFMGSLTTPPCTEGVLWMVLKKPVTLSRGQYKLFTQIYAANARPVQALNGRPVREAQ